MGDSIMATTINADTSEGLKLTSDTSGELELQANGVTKAKVTSSGLTDSSGNAYGLSKTNGMYRNLIINGDMQIAQRGTSVSGITSSGYNTCDRWRIGISNGGTWTQSQDTDVPTGEGFGSSLKMQCTTANASLASGDQLSLHQRFEGQNLQHLKKGTANAESFTLSFWVKSNKTGTYTVEFYDYDNTRNIAKTYTIDSANTWEKKTLTYVGDTSGALTNDNALSLGCFIWLCAGTGFSSGTLQTSWGAASSPNRVSPSQVNLADSTSNYINITGLQLEVGEGASDFEFLPYDVQLQRCQRYYFYLDDEGGTTNQVINTGFMYDADRARTFVTFPTTMRTKPAVGSTNIASSIEFNLNGTGVFVPSVSLPFSSAVSTNGALLQGTADSGTGTAGESRYVRIVVSGAKIEFGAEL